MDSPLAGTAAANLDLSKLTDRDKQELQQFVVNESQKARIQQCKSTHVIFLFASPSLTPCMLNVPIDHHVRTLPARADR